MKNLEKIINIVFYKSKETNEKRAKIFYKNGFISDYSYEEAIKICSEFAKFKKINSKESFKELINSNLVYVLDEDELKVRIEEFKKENESEIQEETYDDIYSSTEKEIESNSSEKINENEIQSATVEEKNDDNEKDDEKEVEEVEEKEDEYEDIYSSAGKEIESKMNKGNSKNNSSTEKVTESTNENNEINSLKLSESDNEDTIEIKYLDDGKEVDISNFGQEEEKKEGIFAKLKKSKLVRNILIFATTIAVGLGIYSLASRKTLEGKMNEPDKTTTSAAGKNDNSESNKVLLKGDNSFYDDYTYEELNKVNSNEEQKNSISKIYNTLNNFNDKFANAYKEEGKNIKSALTFDETVSLQVAYNNFDKAKIQNIFNGASISSKELEDNYKSASLQLMGAYVIETKENPVKIEDLIESKEGKEFYKKYHDKYIQAKYTLGDEQIKEVREFYEMVRKDFPITNEIRTEGISHLEDRNSIEPYKLSVAPIIAAAEMIFQNLEIDNTLQDYEIDFYNDIGLCNYAKSSFDKMEILLLVATTRNNDPLYEQYRKQIIKEAEEKGNYYIDDEHRELTKLTLFQQEINGHFNKIAEETANNDEDTYTEENTYVDESVDYHEEVETKEKEITPAAKKEVDKKVAKENSEAKKSAEKKAEEKREIIQKEENKKSEKIKEEVKKDNKDMQEKIEKANEKIDNGQTVNESDFGNHNVDFDNSHSDENGNLDKSVENITTDNSGYKNEPLPDPNATGKGFDNALTNEKIVDNYVEQMTEQKEESENGYQYVR